MKRFKLLREKFQKGFSIPHHVNPTPRQVVQFLGNTKYKCVKGLLFEGNIYVWDSRKSIHSDFMEKEIQEPMKPYIDFAFDPELNSEGTFIDGRLMKSEYKNWFEEIIDTIEEKYNIKYEIRKNSLSRHRYHPFKTK